MAPRRSPGRCAVPFLLLSVAACGSTSPPRIPAVPSAVHVPARRVPAPTDDLVEVGRAATAEPAGRRRDEAGRFDVPAGARVLVDLTGAVAEPATVGPLLEQKLVMAMMQRGRTVVDAAAVGAQLRERSWDANRPRIESFDLADLLWIARDPSVNCSHVLRGRRIAVVSAESRDVDLSAVPEVQDFLARNPGLEVPTTIRVPTVIGHLDLQLVDVATGEVRWVGSLSADLIDALGERAKVRIACTRRVTNGDAVVAAIAAHETRVAAADTRVKEAWRTLTHAYERQLGNDEIEARRAVFDTAAAELAALAEPPPAAEAPWEYAYTSSFELATGLADDDATLPAREAALVEHLVQLALAPPSGS